MSTCLIDTLDTSSETEGDLASTATTPTCHNDEDTGAFLDYKSQSRRLDMLLDQPSTSTQINLSASLNAVQNLNQQY